MAIQDIVEEAAVYRKLHQNTLNLAMALQRCEQLQAELVKAQADLTKVQTEKAQLEVALEASKGQVNSLLSERDQKTNDPQQ